MPGGGARTARAILLGLGALLAVALLAVAAPAATAASPPLDGNGSWIWYVSDSGGSPDNVARKAAREGLDVVYVKSADGTDAWSQFSPALVKALHKRGISVCAWPFVYGSDPKREAKASAAAAAAGADCIVIDAESSYEGRYRQAYLYIHKLRRLVGPNYPIGLSSFPYTDYHPTFPYSVFLGADGADFDVPQIYWYAIGTSVQAAFEHTYRFNRAYDRPIYPVGQTYGDPPRSELLDFRRYARSYDAPGVSWYSWQETKPSQWKIVGRRAVKPEPGYKPETDYATIERGDQGDMVVLAQELLEAAGRQAAPSGVFDSRTKRAVLLFQNEHGLRPSGRIGTETWLKLTKRAPLSTNWKRVKVPPALHRTAKSERRRSELPAGIGRG